MQDLVPDEAVDGGARRGSSPRALAVVSDCHVAPPADTRGGVDGRDLHLDTSRWREAEVAAVQQVAGAG